MFNLLAILFSFETCKTPFSIDVLHRYKHVIPSQYADWKCWKFVEWNHAIGPTKYEVLLQPLVFCRFSKLVMRCRHVLLQRWMTIVDYCKWNFKLFCLHSILLVSANSESHKANVDQAFDLCGIELLAWNLNLPCVFSRRVFPGYLTLHYLW
jgi:hypothetical protein